MAMMFAGALAAGNTQATIPNSANFNSQQRVKDSTNQKVNAPRPTQQRKFNSGSDNPYRHTKTIKGNQRQYRKYLRQNPHIRNSKKIRNGY